MEPARVLALEDTPAGQARLRAELRRLTTRDVEWRLQPQERVQLLEYVCWSDCAGGRRFVAPALATGVWLRRAMRRTAQRIAHCGATSWVLHCAEADWPRVAHDTVHRWHRNKLRVQLFVPRDRAALLRALADAAAHDLRLCPPPPPPPPPPASPPPRPALGPPGLRWARAYDYDAARAAAARLAGAERGPTATDILQAARHRVMFERLDAGLYDRA